MRSKIRVPPSQVSLNSKASRPLTRFGNGFPRLNRSQVRST
jgi:hypothetical protein